MNKLDAITASKIIRKCLDEVLQEMKEHKNQLCLKWDDSPENMGEVLANHMVSIRAVEEAIDVIENILFGDILAILLLVASQNEVTYPIAPHVFRAIR